MKMAKSHPSKNSQDYNNRMQTIVSPFEYSPDEYNIVAMPSGEALEKIIQLQNILGDAIWLMQPSCLHITVMEIICHTDYGDKSRRELFEQWRLQCDDIVREVLAEQPQLTLHFSELIVSPGAIIIKTAESQQLNDIRAKLLSRTKLPDGTKIPPDITHCSIARYGKSIDLEQAQYATRELSIDLGLPVKQFKLMNDLVPPDFNPNCVETYELKA